MVVNWPRKHDDDGIRPFNKKSKPKKLFRNWIVVSLGNLLGALFMAYFLGHYVGLSEGAAAAKPSRDCRG